MNRFFKIFLMGLIIFGLLMGAAAMALKIYLTPQKIHALLEKQLASVLHREVKSGAISVSLFSGVQVEGFKISERPRFSEGTFISTDRLIITPRLLPLLAKKIIFQNIVLVGPEISIVRNENGKDFNFSDFASAKKTSEDSSSKAASALPFLVAKAQIQNGSIKFVDQSPQKQSASLQKLNITAQNVSLAGPISLEIDSDFKMQPLTGHIHTQGFFSFLKDSLSVKVMEITSKPVDVSLTGSITSLMTSAPSFDLSGQIKNVDTTWLTRFQNLPPDITLSGPLTGSLKAAGHTSQFLFTGDLDGGQINLEKSGQFKKKSGDPLQLRLQAEIKNQSTYAIKELTMKLGTSEIRGQGSMDSNETNIALKSNSIDLKDLAQYVIPLHEVGPTGQAILMSSIKSTKNALKIQGQLNWTGGGLNYEQMVMDLSSAKINFETESRTQTSGTLKAKTIASPFYKGSDLDLEWNLRDITPNLELMSGILKLKQGSGQIQKIQNLTEGSKAARIFFLPLTILQKLEKSSKGLLKLPPLDQLPITSVIGDYGFGTGVMTMKQFEITGPDAKAQMNGTVGLTGAQALNLKSSIEAAGAHIKLTIKGTANDPKASVDTAEIKTKAVEKIKDILGDQKKEKVDELKGLLKGLLKK